MDCQDPTQTHSISGVESRKVYFLKLWTFFLHTQLLLSTGLLLGTTPPFFPTSAFFPFVSYPWCGNFQLKVPCIKPRSSVEFCIHLSKRRKHRSVTSSHWGKRHHFLNTFKNKFCCQGLCLQTNALSLQVLPKRKRGEVEVPYILLDFQKEPCGQWVGSPHGSSGYASLQLSFAHIFYCC